LNREQTRRAISIFYAGLLLLLVILVAVAAFRLLHVLVILLFGVMIAHAIGPYIATMERRGIPRAVGVLGIYVALLLVLIGTGWLVLPPLVRDTAAFVATLPDLIRSLEDLPSPWFDWLEQIDVPEELAQIASDLAGALAQNLATIIGVPLVALELLASVFSVLVFAFLFSIGGDRITGFILSFVHPDSRDQTAEVLHHMGTRLGAFVRSSLLVMTAVGLLTYVGLVLLGVPFPHLLAIVAFFLEAIPMLGPVLAAIPAIILALFDSPLTAVWVTILYIVVQQVESYVIVPIVHGSQLRINPFTLLLAILVGSSLFGLLGALIAVPVAAVLQVFVLEVVVPWRRRQIERDLARSDAPEETAPTNHDEDQ
jgi:predicted PurR-regulated permease PerM